MKPIADFFDIFYIGEGETVYFQMLDLYKEVKASGGTRERFLERAAAEIEGLYIPKYYEADYNEDGTLKRFYNI